MKNGRLVVVIGFWALTGLAAGEVRAQGAHELPGGKVGVSYDLPLQVKGGWPPHKWALVRGELPPGLSLAETGHLSGTPTEARKGPYEFWLRVSDSSEPPKTLELEFKMSIEATDLEFIPPQPVGQLMVLVPPGKQGEKETVRAEKRGGGNEAENPRAGRAPAAAAIEVAEERGGEVKATEEDPGKGEEPPAVYGPLRHDDTIIRGKVSAQASGLEVEVDGKAVGVKSREIKDGKFEVELEAGLRKGGKVRVIEIVDGKGTPSEEVTVEPGVVDSRDTVELSFFIGTAIDSFAGQDVNRLLNANVSSDIKARGVGGFDFAARLLGSPQPQDLDPTAHSVSWKWKDQQLWVYGETVHGTRSQEVDCEKNMAFPTCEDALSDPSRLPTQTFLLLRNATSLEGFAGLRWEFLSLQRKAKTPLSLYAKGQLGFLTVADGPDDAIGSHLGALGVIITKGPLEGSYFEGGFGITELFTTRSKDRWKFDTQLSHRLTDSVSFFAQITVDSDFGGGADSFQSYYGFDFDILELFKTFKRSEK